MKRTALILAAAAAFNLGVMAVATQAQQRTQDPPPRQPVPASPGPMSGAAVQAPGGPGGTDDCTPRPGGAPRPCPPPAISDQAAAGNLSVNARQTPGGTASIPANLRISAMRDGRVLTSARTDARGAFSFETDVGVDQFCVDGSDPGGGQQTRYQSPVDNLLVVISLKIPDSAAAQGQTRSSAASGASSRHRLSLQPTRPGGPNTDGRAGGQNRSAIPAGSSCFAYTAEGSSLPRGPSRTVLVSGTISRGQ
jgi:hypothetical protein